MARRGVLSLTRTTAATVLLVGGAALSWNCGGDDQEPPGGTLGDGQITESKVVVADAELQLLFDATPSADGRVLYFTGVGPEGPGAFSVSATGGPIGKVAVGDPFRAPFGIGLSTDGKTLYVADVGAESAETDGGKLLQVPAEGGAVTEITGTDNTLPRGLFVVAEDGTDQIYYTGATPGGPAGVYKISAAGGQKAVLAEGPPFNDPSGIVVLPQTGDIYVMDTVASKRSLASILLVKGGAVEEFVQDVLVGYPAGIAASPDGSALLVSGLDAVTGVSVVVRVDLLSKERTQFAIPTAAPITEPAGLHRAAGADIYTMVDSSSPNAAIYVLQ